MVLNHPPIGHALSALKVHAWYFEALFIFGSSLDNWRADQGAALTDDPVDVEYFRINYGVPPCPWKLGHITLSQVSSLSHILSLTLSSGSS